MNGRNAREDLDSVDGRSSISNSVSSGGSAFAAASQFDRGAQRATSLVDSSRGSQLESTGGVVEFGDTGPFALRFSTLEYANRVLERNFLVYFHRGRNSSLGLAVMITISCLGFFAFRAPDAEPRYIAAFAALCGGLYAYCGVRLWRLKAQLKEVFAAASLSSSDMGDSSGMIAVDPRLQDALCDNAAEADHVLFLMHVSNIMVVFTAYYPKFECFGLEGDAKENVCVKRFQIDAAIVLLMLTSAIVTPIRIVRFVVLQTLCLLTFVMAHFLPGAIRLDRPFLTFSIGILGFTSIMNVVQVARHELAMRTQFEQFVQLKGYLAELNDVRRRIEYTLRSKAPEAWVRATRGVGEQNLLTEHVVLVCLGMRHYVPWAGVQGPKDVIEMISRVTDVFHRAKQTLHLEALRYPTIGDLWILAFPVNQSTGSLNESVDTGDAAPIGLVPPSSLSGSDATADAGLRTRRILANEALRFLCACVSEGCRVALDYQQMMAEEREAEVPFADPTTSSRRDWVMVDGIADMGRCTVVPLATSKLTTCGGPLLASMLRTLRGLEASAEALGLGNTTTAVVGDPMANELDLPLTAATPTAPIDVPLIRDDGTTETSEVLLVRSAYLQSSAMLPEAVADTARWPFEPAAWMNPSNASQTTSTVGGGLSTTDVAVQQGASRGDSSACDAMEMTLQPPQDAASFLEHTLNGGLPPPTPLQGSLHPADSGAGGGSIGLLHSATSVSSMGRSTATIQEQLVMRREWLLVDVFAHEATEAAYRATRLAAGTIELVVCAVFFLIASVGAVGASLAFSTRSFDTVGSSLPWALGTCCLATGMVVGSSVVHIGWAPIPPRPVTAVVELVYSGLFVTSVVIDWVPGLLAGGSVAWAFFLEFVLLARPLWTGPISMWTLDASAAAAFTVVFIVGPRSAGEPSEAATLSVIQSGVLILGSLCIRLVMERDRRERFSVSHRMTLCKRELEQQYLRLQETIEAFAPGGFAAELTKQQQRSNAHAALMAVLQSGKLTRQRRHRQAFMTTRVRDMVIASVHLQPPPVRPHTSTLQMSSSARGGGDGTPSHDLAYFAALQEVDTVLVETLEAFNDALMSQLATTHSSSHSKSGVFTERRSSLAMKASVDPPPLQVVKTNGDTVLLSALDQHSVGGVSEAEGACLMVLFLKLLRVRLLQGRGEASNPCPAFSMFVSSGPLVGSLVGQEAPTFEFFGPMASCHSAVHQVGAVPPRSIVVTSRVAQHCTIHWTFAAADVASAQRRDAGGGGGGGRSGVALPRFTGAGLLCGTSASFGAPMAWRVRGVAGRLHVCLVL